MDPTVQAVAAATMSQREEQQLAAAEADIERGGMLMARAMRLIRDQRLYRARYASFEEYCRQRWGRTSDAVHKAIARYEASERIRGSLVETRPQSPPPTISLAAANVVKDLPPERAAALVQQVASEEKRVTAQHLLERRQAAAEAAGDSPTVMTDELGRTVPPHLNAAASTAPVLLALGRKVMQVLREAERLAETHGGRHLDIVHVRQQAHHLRDSIGQSRYWTCCPRCNGTGCERCDDSGFLPFSKRNQLSDDDRRVLGVDE